MRAIVQVIFSENCPMCNITRETYVCICSIVKASVYINLDHIRQDVLVFISIGRPIGQSNAVDVDILHRRDFSVDFRYIDVHACGAKSDVVDGE